MDFLVKMDWQSEALTCDFLEVHGDENLLNEGQFWVLKKCHFGHLTALFTKCYSSKN